MVRGGPSARDWPIIVATIWTDAAEIGLREAFDVSLNRTAAWLFAAILSGVCDLDLAN